MVMGSGREGYSQKILKTLYKCCDHAMITTFTFCIYGVKLSMMITESFRPQIQNIFRMVEFPTNVILMLSKTSLNIWPI